MATPNDLPPSVWQQRRLRLAQQKAERARRQQRQRAPRARDDEEDDDEEEDERPARSGKRGKKGAATTSRTAKPRIGFLRGSTVERAFILLIYAGVLLLVVLSVVGTFYGAQSAAAPITQPGRIWLEMTGSGAALWVAIVAQVALSLTQYGARQLARHDARWWLLYLAALGVSVYFNIQAYYTPLLAYMLPGYVYLLILAFDILPEFVSIRHD
jgi:hypothetical protein